MTDDPIRKALREAEKAADAWLVGAVSPAMWSKQASAAAIAAFLRALPAGMDWTFWDQDAGKKQRLPCAALHRLAAAVEREGAGDG